MYTIHGPDSAVLTVPGPIHAWSKIITDSTDIPAISAAFCISGNNCTVLYNVHTLQCTLFFRPSNNVMHKQRQQNTCQSAPMSQDVLWLFCMWCVYVATPDIETRRQNCN